MSYIRSLSNPEGLHIYETARGIVEILQGARGPLRIPRYIFDGVLRKYLLNISSSSNENDSIYRHRGAVLREEYIDRTYKWFLSYGDWQIEMWETTLYFIARSNSKNILKKGDMVAE